MMVGCTDVRKSTAFFIVKDASILSDITGGILNRMNDMLMIYNLKWLQRYVSYIALKTSTSVLYYNLLFSAFESNKGNPCIVILYV